MKAAPLKVRMYGDPCLRKKSDPVGSVGPAERMLAQAMIQTMYKEKGVGLAAPQVGVNQRLFVADIGDGPLVFINPEIVKKVGRGTMEEGCLSIPGVNVQVERAEKVIVHFTDEHDQEMELRCDDLLARVIQHENDHLDGKLIVDYASAEELDKLKTKLQQLRPGEREG